MASFDEKLEAAVQDKVLAGAIAAAEDKSGKLNYSKIVGSADLRVGASKPLADDTVLMLMSCTKLLTTVALLQLVERGLVDLDDDVATHLPTLAAKPVLTGFDAAGAPIVRPRRKPITLRHLLTHSSGLGYDFKEPQLVQWHARPGGGGAPFGGFVHGGIDDRFPYPLLYEPGEGWTYGPGLDYAGKLLEKLTGQTLEDYMREHMWVPLGVDFTFWPAKRGNFADRMWFMAAREPTTGAVGPDLSGVDQNAGLDECFGGQGLYGTVKDYMVVMESLLKDDERLLKRETTTLMFAPQLEPLAKKAMVDEFVVPDFYVGHYPATGGEYDWGFGGVVVDGDSHYRQRGTLTWGGAINTAWWIDRDAGVCGMFGTQLLPPADKTNQAFVAAFEKEIYDRLAALSR